LIKSFGWDDPIKMEFDRARQRRRGTFHVPGLGFGLKGQYLERHLDDSETEGRHPTPIFGRAFNHSIRLFESILIGLTQKVVSPKAVMEYLSTENQSQDEANTTFSGLW
jgi:hypothetical protein